MQPTKPEVVLKFMLALCNKSYFEPELTRRHAEILTDEFFKIFNQGEQK